MSETVTIKKSHAQNPDTPNPDEQASLTGLSQKQQDKYRKQFNRIIKEITQYAKKPDLALLKNAYSFALKAHREQSRLSGDPYIDHCLGTARILTELRMDVSTVAAGLIHDVVEDTGITIDDVVDEFGSEIGKLVDGVTKIGELKFKSQAQQQAENFRKMIFSMAEDLRVIMIKFADRLHNMRTLHFLPHEKAERIAIETRDVYAPLAHRFGIARIKWELEDLAFRTLHPEVYQELVKCVAEKKEEREKTIRRIVRPIKKELIKAFRRDL
jgi:guanosine-3',5'-bis(diphosphate) 3'-pyrophosphohydrolase